MNARAVVRLAPLLPLLVLAPASRGQEADSRAWRPAPTPLATRFARDVDPARPLPEYPRPTLVRERWMNLNGLWDYRFDGGEGRSNPTWRGKILVPFPPESSLSGVGQALDPDRRLVYRRTFRVPADWRGSRLLLHFGAVDWRAEVSVNGAVVGAHTGGYDPFNFEIGAFVNDGDNELVVVVEDPTDAGGQPRGKQWLKPHGIWYTRSSGIWQTVWLEPIPAHALGRVDVVPHLARGALTVRAEVSSPPIRAARPPVRVRAVASAGGAVVASAEGAPGAALDLVLPKPRPWSPDDPFLYDLEISVVDVEGRVVDRATSYAGLREISVGAGPDGVRRLLLNGAPLFQFGPLDQGFWPDGLATAPTDEALRFDVEVVKKMGGNLLRKHVKVEPERFYYWCDRLGVLVWQDMPSGFEPGKGDQAPLAGRWVDNFSDELARVVAARAHHPSIVMWVPFNEGWGQHETERVTELVKKLDPTRLVDNPSGWTDKGVGDVLDIHVYPGPAAAADPRRASVLGEFGGLGLPVAGHTWLPQGNWGYVSFKDQASLTEAYLGLLAKLPPLIAEGLSAAVYTQTTDVEIEVNGWLTYDREVWKIDPARVADATRALYGPPPTLRVLVPRAGQTAEAPTWRFTTTKDVAGDWTAPSFDDAAWERGPAGFGAAGTPGARVGTPWTTGEIRLRRRFTLEGAAPANPHWSLHHDEDVEVYLDGVKVHAAAGYTAAYELVPLSAEARALLARGGEHVLALRCRQSTGGQYVDCGLVDLVP